MLCTKHEKKGCVQMRIILVALAYLLSAVCGFVRKYPFLVFVLLVLAIITCGGCAANVDKAEQAATYYGKKMWPKQFIAVECDTFDSDSNGRVRCSVGHDGDVVAVECPSAWMPQFSTRCVPLKPGLIW